MPVLPLVRIEQFVVRVGELDYPDENEEEDVAIVLALKEQPDLRAHARSLETPHAKYGRVEGDDDVDRQAHGED